MPADDDHGSRGRDAARANDDLGRHRAAAHRGRRQYADRLAVRADASRAKRPVGIVRRGDFARAPLLVRLRADVQEGRAVHRRHQRRGGDERGAPAGRGAWLTP